MTPASIVGTTLVGSSIAMLMGMAEHGAMIAIAGMQLLIGVGVWIGAEVSADAYRDRARSKRSVLDAIVTRKGSS